tara:strand:- start:15 stop:479 length:465 start_codon:yes stop_codon:yes gene_type:complete
MIISCPKCKKKFQIDFNLIPNNGRELQCGSCKNVWFYQVKIDNTSTLTLSQESEDNLVKKEIKKVNKNNESITLREQAKNKDKKIEENLDKKNVNKGGKFFSYLVVLIISFTALIILADTLKKLIINVFPGIELMLFNLFETLHDIKLFIIDLI